LNKTTRSRRGIVWADINGDHLPDLLVAEPDSGQLTVWLQKADGTLGAPQTFPTLTGVSDIAVNDWDGDGSPEIFLLSAEEHQIGVTKRDKNGNIPFPTILPMDGKPLSMTIGNLRADSKPTLAVISEVISGTETRRVLITRTADGKSHSQKLSEDFKSNPS